MGLFLLGGRELQCLWSILMWVARSSKDRAHARREAHQDDAQDEQGRDPDAVRPFHHVGHGGVDEHHRDDRRTPKCLAFCFFRRADRVTAIEAEVMSTSTPVAYAPPWASTSASKTRVMTKPMAVKTSTRGRTARVHSGAMP